jgi:hypothetical protein
MAFCNRETLSEMVDVLFVMGNRPSIMEDWSAKTRNQHYLAKDGFI